MSGDLWEVVPREGVEPTRPCGHWYLKPARLPFRHLGPTQDSGRPKAHYVLPLAFADESITVRETLHGASVNQVADPADRFWDVLTWRLAAGR